ncbi:MAG: hypothetical protein J6B98_05355 [Bacilli bacterium]|nr:hypothetical protein [Bacilli bacterium]
MNSICFTISGFIFLILLLVLYLLKNKKNDIENKIFLSIMITSVCGSLIEIYSFILVQNNIGQTSTIYLFVLKLLFFSFLIWDYLFTLYTVIITMKMKERNNSIIQKIIIISLSIFILISALILSSPIKINNTNGLLLPTGIGVDVIYIFVTIFFIIMIVSILCNYRNLSNKKYYPMYFLILLLILSVAMQKIFPELLMINFSLAIITYIMYFTIENPDIKTIKELKFTKILLEKENNAAIEGFNELSLNLKEPLNKLTDFGNMKISKDNMDKHLKKFQKETLTLVDQINSIIDLTRIENNILENNLNYYKTEELIDSIKVIVDSKKIQATYNISDDIPTTLYGNINQIKQIIIYLTTFINKSFSNFKISIFISKIQVGNICKLKFNFVLPMDSLNSNIELSKINNKYVLNTDNIEYMVYQKLIEQYNNKCVLELNDKNICFNFQLYNKMNANYIEDIKNDEKISHYFSASNKRILILDDNRKDIKEIVDMLNPYKVNIDVSTNIEELITQIDSDKIYDLILYSDTVNVIKEYIVNNENIPRIVSRIKLIAGYKIPLVILGNKKYKNIDYIIKPIDKHELNSIMLKYLADDDKNDGINELK